MNQYKAKQEKIEQLRKEKTYGLFKPKVYTSRYRSKTPNSIKRNTIVEKTFGVTFSARKNRVKGMTKNVSSPAVLSPIRKDKGMEYERRGVIELKEINDDTDMDLSTDPSEYENPGVTNIDIYLRNQGSKHITTDQLEVFLTQEESSHAPVKQLKVKKSSKNAPLKKKNPRFRRNSLVNRQSQYQYKSKSKSKSKSRK
jgi:curved DNA-binding protein CbpA